MNILIVIKVKIPVHIEFSYEYVVKYLLSTYMFGTHFGGHA